MGLSWNEGAHPPQFAKSAAFQHNDRLAPGTPTDMSAEERAKAMAEVILAFPVLFDTEERLLNALLGPIREAENAAYEHAAKIADEWGSVAVDAYQAFSAGDIAKSIRNLKHA